MADFPTDAQRERLRQQGAKVVHRSTYAGWKFVVVCARCGGYIEDWTGQEAVMAHTDASGQCIEHLASRIKELEDRLDSHNF